MAQGKILGNTSGGSKINGIIKEYEVASGGNVSAGDFVTYVNNWNIGEDNQLSSETRTAYTISAVALSENKVFIAHSYASNRYLHGMVCTIDGNTITKGADIELSSVKSTGSKISAVALSQNKVFIAHSYNSSALYAIVCTISDTTITVGTDTLIYSNNYADKEISAVKLTETKVFIVHPTDSRYSLYGRICTISDTTITITKSKDLSKESSILSLVALSEDKFFLVYRYGSGNYLYGTIGTISSTNVITLSVGTLLNNVDSYASKISTVALSENKVFIAHNTTSQAYNLYGMVCIINENTITAGPDTELSTTSYSAYTISATALTENKVLITHSSTSTNYYLYSMLCKISGTGIDKETDTELSTIDNSGYAISATTLTQDKVFIAHSYNTSDGDLYSVLLVNNKKINQITNVTQEILGVAKNSKTSGQIAEVYIPNI